MYGIIIFVSVLAFALVILVFAKKLDGVKRIAIKIANFLSIEIELWNVKK